MSHDSLKFYCALHELLHGQKSESFCPFVDAIGVEGRAFLVKSKKQGWKKILRGHLLIAPWSFILNPQAKVELSRPMSLLKGVFLASTRVLFPSQHNLFLSFTSIIIRKVFPNFTINTPKKLLRKINQYIFFPLTVVDRENGHYSFYPR